MSEFLQDTAPTDDNFATKPKRPASHLIKNKKKPKPKPMDEHPNKPSLGKKITPPHSARSDLKPPNKREDSKSEKSAGKVSGKVK